MNKDSAYEREWFDRLIAERNDLLEKVEKLTAFLKSKSAGLMVPQELVSLQMQKSYMKLYLSVLEERIERNE